MQSFLYMTRPEKVLILFSIQQALKLLDTEIDQSKKQWCLLNL
jgi:hypothetical protein